MYGSGKTIIAITGSLTIYGFDVRFSERPLVVNGDAELAAGGSRTLSATSVSVPGTLDLRNHSMVVNYSGTSPALDLQSRVRSGYQNRAWTGTGIRSSVAATNPGDGITVAGRAAFIQYSLQAMQV